MTDINDPRLNMRPGQSKVIRTVSITMLQAYEQRDEPPGRNPVGVKETILATTTSVVHPNSVQDEIRKAVTE